MTTTHELPPGDGSIPTIDRARDLIWRGRYVIGWACPPAVFRGSIARDHWKRATASQRAAALDAAAPLDAETMAAFLSLPAVRDALRASKKGVAHSTPKRAKAAKAPEAKATKATKAPEAPAQEPEPEPEPEESNARSVIACACGCGRWIPATSHRPRITYAFPNHKPKPKPRKVAEPEEWWAA